MNYDDRAFEQQQQLEEAYFFQTLFDVKNLIQIFGPTIFFQHLFEEYPEFKQIVKELINK